MTPLEPRNFSLTFLNVRENSKGYDGNATSNQQKEVIKSLISPYGRGADRGVHCSFTSHRGSLGFGRQMFEFVRDELSWNKAKSISANNGSVCQTHHNADETGNGERHLVGERVSSQNVMKIDSELSSQQPTSVETLVNSSEILSFKLGRTASEGMRLSNSSPDVIDINFGGRARAFSEDACYNNNNDDDDDNDENENDDNDIGSDDDFHDDNKDSDEEHNVGASAPVWQAESIANESVQVAGKTQLLLREPSTEVSIADSGKIGSTGEYICVHLQQGTETVKQGKEHDISFYNNDHSEVCEAQAFCQDGPLHEISKRLAHISKQKEMLLPLPLLKIRPQSPTELSSASMKLELSLLESLLLQPEDWRDENVDDLCLYGKLAVLFGILSEAKALVIQVTHTLPVGLFNFLDGTVKLGKYSEAVTNKSLSTTESTTLALVIEKLESALEKYVSSPEYGSDTNPVTSDILTGAPVAWVITSPGLGVGLDRELKKNIAPIIEEPSFMSTDFDCCGNHRTQDRSNHSSDSDMRWRHLLMLVDEYRMTDDGIPLAEVYELDMGGHNRVVNFEIL